MNTNQKILTLVFLAMFGPTLLFFPWQYKKPYDYTTKQYDVDAVKYCEFYAPPTPIAKPMLSRIFIEWTALGVGYVGLFLIFKSSRVTAPKLPPMKASALN